MNIVMLGSGNTATVFCRLIDKAQHHIVQVVSRNEENAKTLAAEFNTAYGQLNDPHFKDADLYIAALSDSALEGLERFSAIKGKFVVHTAGAVSVDVLSQCSDHYGVMYPLQTLSRFIDYIPEMPLLVEANTEENTEILMDFAMSLSTNVSKANGAERLSYHIAAIFAGNYANHMFALAEIYCQKSKLDFKKVLPLVNEVTKKVNLYSPFLTQTGPAIRDDVFTLSKHLEALSKYPELKYIYLKITESILKLHGKR